MQYSNNGHMIKFEMFETESSYQCHFSQIGTFVVSIAHYMRAYFNYQALVNGKDFQLPDDAGYLNCIQLQETTADGNADKPLYAKIGCMQRETFTSTKLQLHVYTDSQCSIPYSDGGSTRTHAIRGYQVNGSTFSSRVSFRPPFYSCESCSPESISDTFNKKAGTWYDDDYISVHGQKQQQNDDNGGNGDAGEANDDAAGAAGNDDANAANNNNDDAAAAQQDDYANADDTYMSANDDVSNYYNGNRRRLEARESSVTTRMLETFTPAVGELEVGLVREMDPDVCLKC